MFGQYINGKIEEGKGITLKVMNPSTGELAGTVRCADAAQTGEALSAAEKAFKTWSETPVADRAALLYEFKRACEAERDALTELVSAESGRTYAEACGDVGWFLTSLAYYAEEAKRINGDVLPPVACGGRTNYHFIERKPLGVTVGHLAWNYPLGNAGLKIAPAVASGCTCIIKPSSETPLATLYAGAIAEKIGFPAGVLNIVCGPSSEVAKTLNESRIPRMISLIGAHETGLKLLEQSVTSVKKYSLELGGNAPVIVMNDADIDETAENIVAKKTGFAGQTCVNYNRIFVHERIYDAMCEKISALLSIVKPGKWKDEGRIMGPLINVRARDRMLSLIDDAVGKGAELVTGGVIPAGFEKGSYITPALLKNVTDDMKVSEEEIFGPLIPLRSFTDLDEAIKSANNTIFGLSAYFFGHDSRNIMKFKDGVNAGEIFINGGVGSEFSPHAGSKQSGVGCDKSRYSLEEYYDFRFVSLIP